MLATALDIPVPLLFAQASAFFDISIARISAFIPDSQSPDAIADV